MSTFLEYTFSGPFLEQQGEVLIALLDQAGYEGFIEEDNSTRAYILLENRDEEQLRQLIPAIAAGELFYTSKEIPEQNWNEAWERDFQPVRLGSDVIVRAPFHEAEKAFKYEILVEPKMSFGTGHHATTLLMLKAMLTLEFGGKGVLDLGCGTGILAIFASMLGASRVDAVDIDEWAFRNAIENIELNSQPDIHVMKGNVESLGSAKYDIVLANINRNVLLAEMEAYAKLMNPGGLLLLSGFLEGDVDAIEKEAMDRGFLVQDRLSEKQWASILFLRGHQVT